MHTYVGFSCTINYNSDLSGDVIITTNDNETIEVYGKDLLDFVANYVRNEQISQLETMSTNEILKI